MNATPPPIEEIATLVQQSAKRLGAFSYIAVLSGLLLGPAPFIASFSADICAALDMRTPSQVYTLRGFGIVVSILLIALFFEQRKKNRNDHKLLDVLRNHPERLVWVYKELSTARTRSHAATTNVGAFHHVYFHFVDGTHVLVWLSPNSVDRLMDLVAKTFPDISIGYADELRNAYKIEPIVLRNRPRRGSGVKRISSG